MALAAALAARKGRGYTPNRRARRVRPLKGTGLASPVKPRLLPPAAPKNPHAFTPFKYPTSPPPGSYDPALDAQVAASARGLGDVKADTTQNDQWSLSDYLLARGNTLRQRGEGLADLIRSRQNTKEDYLANVAGVNRNYSRLANTQAQAVRSTGNSSGVLAQALRKRTANRAIDQQPLDTNLNRANTASNIAQTRLMQGTDRQLGALGQTYQRGVIERGNTLDRAARENTNFGLDVAQERFYQARGTGYTPSPPANEFKRHGLTYQVSNAAVPKRTYTLPSGRRFSRQQWIKYLRTRRR